MNEQHLGRRAVTVFEALEGAGLTTAAVNITCYRGTTKHRPALPGLSRPAFGPRRFFFYNLFESDVTGAPVGVGGRAGGSLDRYAAAVGRWLVTRDGFDFFACYLPDYDFASHASGPGGALDALGRSDRAIGALIEAAGGPDEFLERYALIVCSDHGQTAVAEVARLEDSFRDVSGVLVTASNRAGMIYRLPGCAVDVAELAATLDADPATDVALYLEGEEAVARRDGAELRFAARPDGWRTSGDVRVLDHPDGLERAWAALRNPNAGDVLVSAAPGFEFADLGGRHHEGGGSHGSLAAEDSLVPMLAVGIERIPASITEVAPAVLEHFGVEPPAYAASLAHAA